MSQNIPTIDLTPLHDLFELDRSQSFNLYKKSHFEQINQVAKELRSALNQFGCFYLTNHGIPKTLISDMFDVNIKFFDLPEEVKLKYTKDVSNITDMRTYFGYNKTGREKLDSSKFEIRENFDIQENFGNYPNDDEVPKFQSSASDLYKHGNYLVKNLLRLLAIGLNLEDTDYFLQMCKHLEKPEEFLGFRNLRLLHYPKINEQVEESAIRCAEHSDFGMMTFLFQDNIGGLEVFSKSTGEWIPVLPKEDAIFVITGKYLEYILKGFIKAIPHRVVVGADEIKIKPPRYSVAFFNGPDVDAEFYPIEVQKLDSDLKGENENYSDELKTAKDIHFNLLLNLYK